MTPKKRQKANVQEILKNPVQSNQKPLFKQKEGIWGWLSYIGWTLTIVFPLIIFLYNLFRYSFYLIFDFPLFDFGIINLIIISLGIIITIVNILKSKHPLSNKIRKIILSMFVVLTVILELIAPDNLLGLNVILNMIWFISWLWCFLLFWYLHYFYRKSKDGYRRVWLKVILFTIIPILPLFWWRWQHDTFTISNVVYVGDDYPYYEGY